MIHLSQLSGDEKILRSRFQDAMDAARFKNQRKFVGFLDVRQQEILKAVALSVGFSSWQIYGGFQEAERKVAGFFPEYVNGDESLLSSFPIVPLTARFREQDKLSHRDFLGSLMSLRHFPGNGRRYFGWRWISGIFCFRTGCFTHFK